MSVNYSPVRAVPKDVDSHRFWTQTELDKIALAINAVGTSYLQLDAANGPLTGTLGTQALLPDADTTRNIGSETLRYGEVWADSLRVFSGTGTPSITGVSPEYATIIGNAIGTTATVAANSTALGGGVVIGSAKSLAGSTATLTADENSVAIGFINQGGTTTGAATIESTNTGSLAVGAVQHTSSTTAANITASGKGALAGGFALDVFATGPTEIVSSSFGSFAWGNASDSTFGTGSAISATSNGSFAVGNAVKGNITASNVGAMAVGSCQNYDITASGSGGGAFGYAVTGDIISTAANAWQYGEGTNSTAGSIQVEGGVRIEGSGKIYDQTDSAGIYFGAADDDRIYHDGTDLILDPAGTALIGTTGQKNMKLNNIEVDGALNHDGTTAGFYNTAPVAQATDINALALTTHSGTPNTTLVDVSGSGDDGTINDNFNEVGAQINALRTVLRDIGIMA